MRKLLVMGKKVAFGLVRVSTNEQDMQSQKDSLRKIANGFGYTIADDGFFEEKITGYDEDDAYDRQSIIDLSNKIVLDKPKAIFVLELSRLTRRAIKVSRYIDKLSVIPRVPMYFCDYEIWTIDPETNAINDEGILKLQGGAQAVEIERERIKARTSRGRDAKAEKGYYVGHLKDGYKWEYNEHGEKVIIIDEERREMIELIFDLYLKKEMTTGEIRDYLNARIEQYPTSNRYRYLHPEFFKGYKQVYRDKSGNQYLRDATLWTDGMVSSILRDKWYKGVRYYHLNDRKKDKAKNPKELKPTLTLSVPRIIDEKSWDACNERLQQFRMRISTAKQPYLLTGLLFCGVCGRKLYGHSDGGYNDMYYCSSYEYGRNNKCGLKWVRRQNLDAILVDIVKRRVYADAVFGQENHTFSDFFSIDANKLQDINNNLRTYSQLITKAEKDIAGWNKQIQFYIQQQGKCIDNPRMLDNYQIQIDSLQQQIIAKENNILGYKKTIDNLKKQKNLSATVKEKMLEIDSLADYEKMKGLMNHVIERITLYNPDKASTIIEITYVNGKMDTAIYSPTRMLKKYIVLTSIGGWCPLRYDKDKKEIVFEGMYYGFDGRSEMYFEEELTPEDKNQGKTVDDVIASCQKDGYRLYKDRISVREYIDLRRNSTLNVYHFEDLLPLSEKGQQSKNYHAEYIKRYNTGKPTFTPFIEKDADYEEIQKKRKRLYNRKNKILNNKHLSQQEKDEQIYKIMEQLEAFKFQLKYLPTNRKGVQHIEKYGK